MVKTTNKEKVSREAFNKKQMNETKRKTKEKIDRLDDEDASVKPIKQVSSVRKSKPRVVSKQAIARQKEAERVEMLRERIAKARAAKAAKKAEREAEREVENEVEEEVEVKSTSEKVPKRVSKKSPKEKTVEEPVVYDSALAKEKRKGDKYARYGQYQPEEFTAEEYEQIKSNKKNQWHESVKTNDMKYDSRYMDPKFLAYQAAKKGLKPLYGDFDNDGVPDSAMVDENYKLKSFNGYTTKPSKRHQYAEFYKKVPPKELNDAGYPVYEDFNEFYDTYVQELDNKKMREELNKNLAKSGFATYKVKEKTFNEIIGQQIRDEYKLYIGEYCKTLGITQEYFKKIMPMNTLVSLYIRSMLNALFGADYNATTDSEQGRWITKTINKKYPEGHEFYGFKQNLIQAFTSINEYIGRDIIMDIFGIFAQGGSNDHVLGILYQELSELIPQDQFLYSVSVDCKNALKTRLQESKRNFNMSKKQVSTN